jgi:transketolase
MKLTVAELECKARELRLDTIRMIALAGGGHLGGSLSAMDIMTALYFNVLRIDPCEPDKRDRDRFILSAGHKAAGYVPVLADRGFFPKELLATFNKLESRFGMHPDKNKIPGCDASTGSLGHGLPVGLGMALALRLDGLDSKVFVLLGDGELHEGTNWEAAMGAAQHKASSLVAIVDYNKCSMDGPIDSVVSLEPIVDKWRSFGWDTIRIDGNDMAQVLTALREASARGSRGKPVVIIADTVKGKGAAFAEGDYRWHYGCPSEEQMGDTITALGGR